MASHSHDHATPALEGSAGSAPERTATVLVYSSHDATRARVMRALGRSPATGLALTYVEAHERITGRAFEPPGPAPPVHERVLAALGDFHGR